MTTNIVKKKNYVVVELVGSFLATNVKHFEEQVFQLIEPGTNMIVDLSKVDRIDSSGVGSLMICLQKLNYANGSLKLTCLQAQPTVVMNVTGTYKIFDIYDTLEFAENAVENES